MSHVFERAPSGRSKCRGCGGSIAKDEIRFGERVPNAFGEGEMTLWFHPMCAAYRRPTSVSDTLGQANDVDVVALEAACELSKQGRRVSRIGAAQRAPSGRARCRSCRELIAKDDWRTPLIFFEDGMFNTSGFAHVACLSQYCEHAEFLPVLLHFAQGLDDGEIAQVTKVASLG